MTNDSQTSMLMVYSCCGKVTENAQLLFVELFHSLFSLDDELTLIGRGFWMLLDCGLIQPLPTLIGLNIYQFVIICFYIMSISFDVYEYQSHNIVYLKTQKLLHRMSPNNPLNFSLPTQLDYFQTLTTNHMLDVLSFVHSLDLTWHVSQVTWQ